MKFLKLSTGMYSVVAVTETWFDNTISDTEFAKFGYTAFRQDRKLDFYTEGTFIREDRGGALLLIKEELHPIVYDNGREEAELIWCQIHPRESHPIVIGVTYRPEKGKMHNLVKICNSIDRLQATNVILLGDFNFKNINWDTDKTR